MNIKKHLLYDCSQDKIIGFVDDGKKRAFIPSPKVLVVMVRGLLSNWKQTVAFYFCKSFCDDTKQILNDCLDKLLQTSLNVKAVIISDQGSNFVETVKSLGVSVDKPYFEFHHQGNLKKNYVFYDSPHLLKSVRNTLLNCNLSGKKASWVIVQAFYNSDKTKPLRIAKNLTDKHIKPNNWEKMRVSLAAQVVSESVAVGISTYVSLGALPAESAGTAQFIEQFVKLFDIFNSSKHTEKKYNLPFNGASIQQQFLNEMLQLSESIKIINKEDKNVTNTFKKCFSVDRLLISILINSFV
jgi:hypothetical protein